MIDKGINVKKIDLSGVSFPTSDASTCALIYTAVRNTYGFPLYLTNFKINDEKRNSVLVSPIILTDSVVINLGDYYLTISATAITATAGVNLIGATIDSDGDVKVGKNLEVDGTIKSMENIVDSDGNKRFVEFNGSLGDVEGVTFTYNKCSLSGTHLMAVLCGTIDANTTIASGKGFCWFTLPSWLYNKIIAVRDNELIDYKDINCFKETGFGVVTFPIRFEKTTNNRVVITKTGSFTTNETLIFRIQFDLLIDAE